MAESTLPPSKLRAFIDHIDELHALVENTSLRAEQLNRNEEHDITDGWDRLVGEVNRLAIELGIASQEVPMIVQDDVGKWLSIEDKDRLERGATKEPFTLGWRLTYLEDALEGELRQPCVLPGICANGSDIWWPRISEEELRLFGAVLMDWRRHAWEQLESSIESMPPHERERWMHLLTGSNAHSTRQGSPEDDSVDSMPDDQWRKTSWFSKHTNGVLSPKRLWAARNRGDVFGRRDSEKSPWMLSVKSVICYAPEFKAVLLEALRFES